MAQGGSALQSKSGDTGSSPPIGLELVCRRLGFWQATVRHQAHLQHFLACFFGRPRYDKEREQTQQKHVGEMILDDGTLALECHPWGRQLAKDLEYRMTYTDAEEFREAWKPRSFRTLFGETYVRELFLGLDQQYLREAHLRTEWAPQGTLLEGFVPAPGDYDDQYSDRPFRCQIAGPGEGSECGRKFATIRQLRAHQRFAKLEGHGARHLLTTLVTSNSCVICNTTFRSVHEAGLHLERSWRQGRCIKDNTKHPYQSIDPPTRHCPICPDHPEFETTALLQAHIRAHIPSTPPKEAPSK